MPLELEVGTSTDKGLVRSLNEDSFKVPDEVDERTLRDRGYLFLLADGMGGHAAGDVASRLAVQMAHETYYGDAGTDPKAALGRAVQAANQVVYAEAQSPDRQGAGTTLVAALLRGTDLWVANVGDSRAYLFRETRLEQITRDHTEAARLVDRGVLKPAEARTSDYRHQLTRSLGQASHVAVDLFHRSLRRDDIVLLCSDGVTELVEDDEIADVLNNLPPSEAAGFLMELANERGGFDNSTAVVVRVTDVPAAQGNSPVEGVKSWGRSPIFWGAVSAMLILLAAMSTPLWLRGGKPPVTPAAVFATATPARAAVGLVQHTPTPTAGLPTPSPTARSLSTRKASPTPVVSGAPVTATMAPQPSRAVYGVLVGNCQPANGLIDESRLEDGVPGMELQSGEPAPIVTRIPCGERVEILVEGSTGKLLGIIGRPWAWGLLGEGFRYYRVRWGPYKGLMWANVITNVVEIEVQE